MTKIREKINQTTKQNTIETLTTIDEETTLVEAATAPVLGDDKRSEDNTMRVEKK